MNKTSSLLLIALFLLATGLVTATARASNGVEWEEKIVTTETPFNFFPANEINTMSSGDADNDGKVELLIGSNRNFQHAQMARFIFDSGEWSKELIVPSGPRWWNKITGMAIGDVDGDGMNEFAYGLGTQGNGGGGECQLREWVGSGWMTSTILGGIPGAQCYAHQIVDLDGDGSMELVGAIDVHSFGRIDIVPYLFKLVGGSWTNMPLSSVRDNGPYSELKTGDFDGDGLPEIVRPVVPLGTSKYQYHIIEWESAWVETVATELPSNSFGPLGPNGISSVGVGDLDGDSMDEFAVVYWLDTDSDGNREAIEDSIVVRVLDFHGGTWSSSEPVVIPKPGNWNVGGLTVGDANNDGRADIYLAIEDGSIAGYTLRDGIWVKMPIPSTLSLPWWYAITDDVDNDGHEDLVVLGVTPDGSEFGVAAFSAINRPPLANADGPYLVAVGQSIAFDGTGSTDPDGDTLTYTWTFGDSGAANGPVPSHVYASAGIYDVCLMVDDGIAVDTACTMAVVYDPEGGFVTGGGWIWSPLGALPDDPTLEGKASFGFVSKYKKGADVPSGQTDFHFQVADLHFHSDTYDWLVVAGARAQFKGVGTINGEGAYKFILTAIDADIYNNDAFEMDRFRIKIWVEDAGGVEEVVYDNQMDETLDSDATTEIGGGAIVIHKAK